MKSLKFICTGDWHLDANPIKQKKAEASLNEIINYCSEVKVEAIIIAGDLWHKKQSFSESSAVPYGIEYLRKLSKLVNYIFITRGNAAHDEAKSISLLHQIESNVFAYEQPVCLAIKDNKLCDLLRTTWEPEMQFDYILSLVPYPVKSAFITEDSIDNNNAGFIEKFEQVFDLIGDMVSNYNCPKILGFHGNVIGSRLSSGQTLLSQDIMVSPSTLQKAKHNYYALSHIHLYQEVANNMFYSSSLYCGNWGETEQKSFQVVTFEDGEMNVERIMLTSARPMITLNAEFKDGEFCFEDPGYALEVGMKEYEYRLKVKIKENERNLVTDDKIENIKFLYTEDVKIEWSVIPVERESRSEQIMNCRSLLDEVVEYGNITAADVFSTGTEENFLKPSLIDKVTKIVEKGVES